MARFKITNEELVALKSEIMKGKLVDSFSGMYECGCCISPRHRLINKLCKKHQGKIKEA